MIARRNAAAVAAVLLLAGCGGEREGNDGGTQVSVSGIGLGGAAAPANLPPFAPVYPGASVETTTLDARQPDKGMMVLTAPGGEPAAVIAFYKQKGVAAGLEAAVESTAGEARTLTMVPAGGDGASASSGMQVVAAPDGDGGTTVTVVYSGGSGN